MKAIVFCGGGGKRFWPLSREKYPKQFTKILGEKSTLQMSLRERLQPVLGWHNVYVATLESYVQLVKEEVPELATHNIFTEPARRDVGPAVALDMLRFRKMGIKEPVMVLWADHLIKDIPQFQEKMREAEMLILQNKAKLVLWGEKFAFPNSNQGWIHIDRLATNGSNFVEFKYRPPREEAEELFKTGDWLWNTGYYITTPEYVLSLVEKYYPDMYQKLLEIEKVLGTPDETKVLEAIYPTFEPIHSDHVVQYKADPKDVMVIESNTGLEDPGDLYAIKRYFENNDENYQKGETLAFDSHDSLVWNETKRPVIAIGLEGMLLVQLKDITVIVHKDKVVKMSEYLTEIAKKYPRLV